MSKEKKVFEKEYVVKKGQEDWRVWSRATGYLVKFMVAKKKSTFVGRRLRNPIKVKIEVYE